MASLPSGYQQVEYIQSSGTQYIDTGFQPDQNTRVVADANVTTITQYMSIFGASDSAGGSDAVVPVYDGSSSGAYFWGNSSASFSTSGNAGRHVVDANKNNLSIDGVQKASAAATSFVCNHSLYLFAYNAAGDAGNKCSMELYSCQIYDDGALVRDFVPCYRTSDNVAGLYDTAQGAFYTNAGAGAFSPGPNVTPSEPAGPVPEIVLPAPAARNRRRLMMAGGGFVLWNCVKYKRGESLVITSSTDIEVVGKLDLKIYVVGGGGGGGAGAYPNYGVTGGGGGSGGLSEDVQRASSGIYSIVVGAGGSPGTFTKGGVWGDSQTAATNGGSSSAFGVTAGGGGKGGNAGVATGSAGTGGAGGTGTTSNGNAGANGKSYSTAVGAGGASVYGGYGAGGAGGRGTSSGSATATAGGAGVVVITLI